MLWLVNMKKITPEGKYKKMIESYDLKDHNIWNATKGDMVEVRKTIREFYLKEQGYKCAYCRMEKKESHGYTWDIEHVLPKASYPEYLLEPENLAIACRECNNPKDDHEMLSDPKFRTKVYPTDKECFKIIHPHFDKYSENMEVVILNGKRIYLPLNSGKGKYTLISCDLCRFSYKFAEWESFDDAAIISFSEFLDNCPADATPDEIKRMLGHIRFNLKNLDF